MMSVGEEMTKRVSGIGANRFRRNKRATKLYAEPDPFDMFQALLDISKGYVQLSNLAQSST